MNFFTRPVALVETTPQAEDASQESRLLEVEKEREQTEQAFNDTFNALRVHDEFRKQLVAEQAQITARRTALLAERAALLKTLGRIK